MIRKPAVLLLFAAAIAACSRAPAQTHAALPNPRLTPGAIASSDPAAICAPGYARSHRLPFGDPVEHQRYATIMATYSVPQSHWHEYQMDDLVPICLGGSNTAANLWPQHWPEAIEKDRAEVLACHSVCAAYRHGTDAGEELARWQQWFLTGGWTR